MTTKHTEFPKLAKGGVVFFLCWLAGFGLSHIWACSRFHSPDSHLLVFFLNQIFFYSQTAVPHSLSAVDGDGHGRVILSGWLLLILSILFWLAIGGAFAWFTRRLRLYFTVPLAVVSVFAALIAAQVFLYLFSVRIDVLSS